jgi:hypothetical protein
MRANVLPRLSVGALVLYEHERSQFAPTPRPPAQVEVPGAMEPVVVYALGPRDRVTVQHGDMTLRDVERARLFVTEDVRDCDLAMQAKIVGALIRARRITL